MINYSSCQNLFGFFKIIIYFEFSWLSFLDNESCYIFVKQTEDSCFLKLSQIEKLINSFFLLD